MSTRARETVRRRLGWALLGALGASGSCGRDVAPTGANPTFAGQPAARVALTLNGQKGGTHSCYAGLYFVASVLNPTSAPLFVRSSSLRMESPDAACRSHDVPLRPAAPAEIPPGGQAEVRRLDWAGGLCGAPRARPGCDWIAVATLETSQGPLVDQLGFVTSRSGRCGHGAPRVTAPLDGTVLSGSVDVRAAPGRSDRCQTSLRSLVRATAEDGAGTAFSVTLDLETYRWQTTTALNGAYLITAQKVCGSEPCGGISPPIRVFVRN